MLVEQILPQARQRLAVIDIGARVRDAAEKMLKPHTDLLVVCAAGSGIMAGIVTKFDIVGHVSQSSLGSDFDAPLETIMTRDVASCSTADSLRAIWKMMQKRGLQRIPILDSASRPIGVVYSRDALQCLLAEVEIEDALLRDYVAGVGYQ